MSASTSRLSLRITRQELVLIFITIVWGGTFLVVHRAMAHSGPFFFVGLRFATASLLLAFVLTTLKYPILLLIQVGVFSVDPTNLLVGLLSLIKSAGYLVFWVIIIRSLMSWISQGRGAMDYVLIQLTEPLMAPIRRILPAMGGIDFSAMIVILVLYALNFLGMDLFPGLWYLL